jgi:hypothetical protein
MFRSIDDEHSLNMYCVYVYPIFPIKLYLKDTVWSLLRTNKGTNKLDKKPRTVGIQMNADCWKERPLSKRNMLSIKHTSIYIFYFTFSSLSGMDRDARLRTKHFDKRDDFNFVIAKFPYLMLQHSNRTCIWSIYLSVGMIFMNSLIEGCCLLGCYWTVTEYLSHKDPAEFFSFFPKSPCMKSSSHE